VRPSCGRRDGNMRLQIKIGLEVLRLRKPILSGARDASRLPWSVFSGANSLEDLAEMSWRHADLTLEACGKGRLTVEPNIEPDLGQRAL